MNSNVYMVGVGGQGILTIGELLAAAAFQRGIPVNFFPSRGMAQRGGHVHAQLRLGPSRMGPNIGEREADVVVAMEMSEALKAIRMIRPGGHFLLYEEAWLPTAALLGKAPYPAVDAARAAVRTAGGVLVSVRPDAIPCPGEKPLPANLFLLGSLLSRTSLKELFSEEDLVQAIQQRWPGRSERNLSAFQAGLAAWTEPTAQEAH